MWAFLYVAAFIAAFAIGIVSKTMSRSWAKDYTAEWNDSVGIVYKDISYGEAESNKFDLYVPAENSKETYGLVVYPALQKHLASWGLIAIATEEEHA